MRDWRKIIASGVDLSEFSAEGMATTRIMKGLGASPKDVGKLCSRFGIEYIEEESTFSRAVKIFREVFIDAKHLDFIDVRTNEHMHATIESLTDDTRTGILFYKKHKDRDMTAFIKGPGLMTGPLGGLVIRPGMKYIMNKNGVEVWEQDPITLIRSFSRENKL